MDALPTHPMLVHLPLALGALSPILCGAIGYAIGRRGAAETLWAWVVAAHFVLLASSGAAALLGETDARRIQTRIDSEAVQSHEDDGHRLLMACALAFGLALAGLVLPKRRARRAAMAAAFAASLICATLAVVAGHGGAVLVYQHGAAAAWSEPP